MKKTNKENPLTFFRKANEARQALVKKSIKKAQYGIQTGPMTQEEAANDAFASSANDPMASGRGPRVTTPMQDSIRQKYYPWKETVKLKSSEKK